ncbi:MAG: ribosome-associated translation inhibitor RaiA [Deltaproteobacteria bacterium]|nr:ribosome-associated translation inhibitor RaiA [Deltaproteobacteria bacterium]
METTVTFRHSDPSPAIKQHIDEKIKKLSKYFMKAIQAHVILTVEKSRHVAEITLSENNHTLYAKEGSHDMYRSLDIVLHKLERQLRKLKEKIKSHHH